MLLGCAEEFPVFVFGVVSQGVVSDSAKAKLLFPVVAPLDTFPVLFGCRDFGLQRLHPLCGWGTLSGRVPLGKLWA